MNNTTESIFSTEPWNARCKYVELVDGMPMVSADPNEIPGEDDELVPITYPALLAVQSVDFRNGSGCKGLRYFEHLIETVAVNDDDHETTDYVFLLKVNNLEELLTALKQAKNGTYACFRGAVFYDNLEESEGFEHCDW